ncbi:hypothetical protein [Actinomadura rupiterrae]|uniref:hypothetical protein n=1 Tax=Actinomadura rupiterrae TaxID=559627 RepID=UPI0020A4E8BA|nr:hypothetical protein [Actinomadura rupiterrae]MCP2337325.1 hypothetical protein [Actinomadura rupiterrae]
MSINVDATITHLDNLAEALKGQRWLVESSTCKDYRNESVPTLIANPPTALGRVRRFTCRDLPAIGVSYVLIDRPNSYFGTVDEAGKAADRITFLSQIGHL